MLIFSCRLVSKANPMEDRKCDAFQNLEEDVVSKTILSIGTTQIHQLPIIILLYSPAQILLLDTLDVHT
jgi:hypothetical protein